MFKTMKRTVLVIGLLALGSTVAQAQKLTWSRIWGTTNFGGAVEVARDPVNNFYVAGDTYGAFDGQTNSGGKDAFVTKFDPAGNRQWTRIWGSAGDDSVAGVAVDDFGNSYVTGTTTNGFHSQTNTRAGSKDMFLTKWATDGTWVWTRIWGSSSDDTSAGVVIDSKNDPYVGGTTAGSFGTLGQTNTRAGLPDFCLSAYDKYGAFQWSQIWGGTNGDTCYDIAIDPYDYIYLCGDSRNDVFDGQPNNYAYDRLALTGFNAQQSPAVRLWSRVWGATNKHNAARSVCAYSYVYVAGWTFGSFDGESNKSSAGNSDFYVSQFEFDSGNRNWTRIHGTNSIEEAHGVAQDVYGNAYVTGIAFANLDGQTRVGGSDYLLLKYDAGGARQWTRLWGSVNDDNGGYGLVLDTAGNVIVCGSTYGSFGGQINPGGGTYENPTLTRWRMTTNTPPKAIITRPTAGREFLMNEPVLCIGQGDDVDDGPLTNLVWRIGTNGVYGYGPTCTVSAAAAAGQQTVTLRVADTESGTGVTSVAVTVLADGGSGLPQSWETNHWPAGNSGGATNDFDHDGADNWTEWQCGTNPTNSQSVFRFGNPRTVPGRPQIVLEWPSASNRQYVVSMSSNLPNGFMPLTAVTPTPPLNTYTTPASPSPQGYYRVEVDR